MSGSREQKTPSDAPSARDGYPHGRKRKMNRYVPSIEIDEEIREKAKKQADICWREMNKSWAKEPRLFTDDSFRKGFIGELATRRYLGLPLILKNYLDLGYDLLYNGQRIDVKTSMIYEPLRQPLTGGFRVFVSVKEKLGMVDILLFTKLEPDESKAHLIGWIWREDLEKAPIVQMGNMPCPAYNVYFSYMKPIEDLISD